MKGLLYHIRGAFDRGFNLAVWRLYFIAKFTTNYNVLVKHAMYIKIVMFAIRQFAFTFQ